MIYLETMETSTTPDTQCYVNFGIQPQTRHSSSHAQEKAIGGLPIAQF